MRILNQLTGEYKNSIGKALIGGLIAIYFQHIYDGKDLASIKRKVEQRQLREGIYLRNCSSMKRCCKVIDYYEDIFGTFEWAH